MRRLLPLLLTLVATPAFALTEDRSGLFVEAAAGGLLALPPIAGGLGWEANAGWWFGPSDPEYSIVRYVGVGAGLRQDLRGGDLHTAAVVEVRRGFDLVVVGTHLFAAAGPTFGAEGVGGLAEIGVGAKGRFGFTGPYTGIILRLHAGAEVGPADPVGRVLLTVGFHGSGPIWGGEE